MSPNSFDPSAPLGDDLAELEAQLEAAEEEAAELCSDLSAEQLVWRPDPGSWSVAECLDHLSAVGYKVLPRLRRAVTEARSRGALAKGPWKPSWLGRRTAGFMEPPYRLRMKAPSTFLPPPPEKPRQTVREFIELQGELIKVLREANGVDFSRTKVVSPVSRWLKMGLGDYFLFLLAHQRRHLWQAARVRRHQDFPASA